MGRVWPRRPTHFDDHHHLDDHHRFDDHQHLDDDHPLDDHHYQFDDQHHLDDHHYNFDDNHYSLDGDQYSVTIQLPFDHHRCDTMVKGGRDMELVKLAEEGLDLRDHPIQHYLTGSRINIVFYPISL